MNPHISLPRQHGGQSTFGGTSSRGRSSGLKMPRFFKQLPRFSQLDFELATSEMISLLTAPKKVFRSIYYHKQTKNTYHTGDPSFTILLSFFMLLTSLAWSLAYTYRLDSIIEHLFSFIFVHFIGTSLVVAIGSFFFVGRLLGPGVPGLPGRRRAQGLFQQANEDGKEQVEFGYCFDVAIRAFFPIWVFLYVVQFLLWPVISRDYWISLLLGNTLYLTAFCYWTLIVFLGFNALPSLSHTHLLLSPMALFAVLWFASLFGYSLPKHVAPVLLQPFRRHS